MNKDYIVDYSIVIPVYYNEGSLKKTYEVIVNEVISKNKDKTCEIIFIDDGSKDNSYSELLLLQQNSEIVKVIKLTRNFGQVAAIMAGYQHARGKCIINLSADLQDPPQLINLMLEKFFKEEKQLVICTRKTRDESWFRRFTSKIFYSFIKKLQFSNMPEGGFDFALISARLRDIVVRNTNTNPFWQGQLLWAGYEPVFIEYDRQKREIGKSRWTLSKKIKYLIDGVLGYSYFPIRLMSVLGLIVFLLGAIYALVISVLYFFGHSPFKGWAPIMILILVLSGFQMLMLGIIGEYLWRTLEESRKKELFLIDKIVE